MTYEAGMYLSVLLTALDFNETNRMDFYEYKCCLNVEPLLDSSQTTSSCVPGVGIFFSA